VKHPARNGGLLMDFSGIVLKFRITQRTVPTGWVISEVFASGLGLTVQSAPRFISNCNVSSCPCHAAYSTGVKERRDALLTSARLFNHSSAAFVAPTPAARHSGVLPVAPSYTNMRIYYFQYILVAII